MAKKTGKPVKKQPAKVSDVPRRKLPSAWYLTKTAAQLLWRHKKVLAGIILVYGLLNLVLVQGLANSTDIGSLKDNLNSTFSGHLSSLASSLGVFAVLVGSAGNGSSQTAGGYQFFLAILTSLAIIWALRQLLAGTRFGVRDAYYRGMYPLVPFILVLIVIGLQLLPLLIGSSLYGTVMSNGIAASGLEHLLWGLLFVILALWSLYMLSASVLALYMVTLPDMTPLKALRSAKELVNQRRWTVLRKILWLPIVLLLVAAVVMVPIIVWLTPLSQWVFFVLTMFALLAVHGYLYTLYRELLNE
jgi:hypothetical protein